MKGMGEEVLREPTRTFLQGRGYEVFDEVPIAGRFADLIGIREGEVVAVELKLAQWRVALLQARTYQLGAHYAYVAFPLRVALRLERNPGPFGVDGIGLLGISPDTGEAEVLIHPRPSSRFLPFVSDHVVEVAMGSDNLSFEPSIASMLADLWQATS